MAQLPSYAEVLRKPECLDPDDYSGKVKFLPHWPKIHPDHKPEHLNKPEHRWIFGHPVMILSRGPSEKGNVDVCVLRTFQGRGLQAEHGNSLQSRFYMHIHPEPQQREPFTGQPLTEHPFTGPPTIPVLYLINPEYRILKKCWVNLKRTFTLPYHCLEDFMGADNRTIPTLTRTSYCQMVGYQRDAVPGLVREEAMMEEVDNEEAYMERADTEQADTEQADTEQAEMVEAVIDGVEMEQVDMEETVMVEAEREEAEEGTEMEEATSISVRSDTSSAGISSGTVSFGGSSSEVSPSEVSPSEVSTSQGPSSQGVSSQGSSFEGSSVEGSSVEGSFVEDSSCNDPPPDGSSSECPTSEPHTSDGPPS